MKEETKIKIKNLKKKRRKDIKNIRINLSKMTQSPKDEISFKLENDI